MPTTRLWVGGENDFFSPNAWSPPGRPSHGDTLTIGPGTATTANIATVDHRVLQDMTVLLDDGPGLFGSPFVPTLALTDAGIGKGTLITNPFEMSPALGASDTEQILIDGRVRNQGTIAENPGALIGNTLSIDLADNAKLINGRAGVISGTTISNLNIEGGPGSVLVNRGDTLGHGTKVDIGVPVTGHGTFEMLPGANPGSHTPITSELEFHQAVSAGQTIKLNDTMLVLDLPLRFLATIDDLSVSPPSADATDSSILLKGAQATDLSFNNDVLTVRNGSDTLAQLHFTAGLTGADFELANTAQGASIGIVAPMTTLTKIADLAFTNFAFGWSPNERPQDGDTLIANTGTVVQLGGRLPDTTLNLGFALGGTPTGYLPTPTFDMIGGTIGTVDVTTQTPDPSGAYINVFGHATIDDLTLGATFAGDRATVNIAPFSRLTTTINGGLRSNLQVSGGSGAVLDNEGHSTVNAATIAANVVGSGSWSGGIGRMEFTSSVGAGQSIDLAPSVGLTIDNDKTFHALVSIEPGWGDGNIGRPDILLSGIHGDSWTYQNDMLKISNAGHTVGQLHIHDVGAEAFTVMDTAAGTSLVGNFGLPNEPQQFAGTITPAMS